MEDTTTKRTLERLMRRVMELEPAERGFRVKVLPGGRLPERMTSGAAGLDCYAAETVRVFPYETRKIPLGFACEIPAGYVGLLFLRSSIALEGVAFAPGGAGVIDADYRSEVNAIVSTREHAKQVNVGDRIVQLVIVPCGSFTPVLVDELPTTRRGEGGFGSTGK